MRFAFHLHHTHSPLSLKVGKMALHVKSVSVASPLAGVSKIGPCQRDTVVRKTPPVPCGRRTASRLVAVRASAETEEKALTGVVFEPFREVQSRSLQLPDSPHESLARQRFETSCESAINNQINVEYNASYIYHSLFAYFDRDNVALPGLAKYFQDSSAEEREHAEKFMEYQNKRGGRVKLQSIILPPMEFGHSEKGDALNAMEVTLALEKLTTEKLYSLHKAAEDADDIVLQDYVEGFLTEQIEEIKKVSTYVAQLRRIGSDGHGVYQWDRELSEDVK